MPDTADVKFVGLPGVYDQLGYHSAKSLTEAGVYANTTTGDYEMRYDRATLVNISRKLDRDNWLYEGALNRAADYILGPVGFTLQAKTGVAGVDARIENELWPTFAESPEVREMHDFIEVQNICLRELFAAGDTLFSKLATGLLQHFESERIADTSRALENGDRIEQGIVLDTAGRIKAFKISDVSAQGYIRSGSSDATLDAKHAIYVMGNAKRSSQSRCVPVLSSAMPLAHRLDDILTAETIAWQVMSRLVVSMNREGNARRLAIRDGHNATTRDDAVAGTDASTLITEIGHAILVQGRPGDEVKGINQNRPHANFEQAVKLFVRLFGVPLGIPMEVILLDWGKTNYSVSRAILLQAFLNFRRWQQRMIRKFFVPVYRWQISRWIAQDKLTWRPGIFSHVWNVPSWPWIDEDKEVDAWAKKIDRAMATQTQAFGALGQDREEQQSDRETELIDAWKRAREVEEATNGEIKAAEIWRHFAGFTTGKTESAVRAADVGATPDDAPKPPNQADEE